MYVSREKLPELVSHPGDDVQEVPRKGTKNEMYNNIVWGGGGYEEVGVYFELYLNRVSGEEVVLIGRGSGIYVMF